MAQILKKLSVKTVCGSISKKLIEQLKANGGAAVPVMRVLGIATGSKSGQTNFGPWVSLTGNFEAVNLETGQTFKAQNLLMPMGYCEDGALKLQQEGVTNLNVACDVFVRYFKFGEEDKYEYTLEAHQTTAEEVDPLASLRAAVPPAPLRLKAPETSSSSASDAAPASQSAESGASSDTSATAATTAKSTKTK